MRFFWLSCILRDVRSALVAAWRAAVDDWQRSRACREHAEVHYAQMELPL